VPGSPSASQRPGEKPRRRRLTVTPPSISITAASALPKRTCARISVEIPTCEPPFNSAARSSALKCAVPKLETGKSEDLPLPGGPATTIIFGGISRQSHGLDLPACRAGRDVLADAAAGSVDQSRLSQTVRRGFRPLCRRREMGIRFGRLIDGLQHRHSLHNSNSSSRVAAPSGDKSPLAPLSGALQAKRINGLRSPSRNYQTDPSPQPSRARSCPSETIPPNKPVEIC